jgi:hypothetical protein
VNGFKVGEGEVEGREEVKERKEEAVEEGVNDEGECYAHLKATERAEHQERVKNVGEGAPLRDGGVQPVCGERDDVVLQHLTFRFRIDGSYVETGGRWLRGAERAMEGQEKGGRLFE